MLVAVVGVRVAVIVVGVVVVDCVVIVVVFVATVDVVDVRGRQHNMNMDSQSAHIRNKMQLAGNVSNKAPRNPQHNPKS